jgi:hypothetical protein
MMIFTGTLHVITAGAGIPGTILTIPGVGIPGVILTTHGHGIPTAMVVITTAGILLISAYQVATT